MLKNFSLSSFLNHFIHQPGSDHPIHVRIILMIRRNGFKYKSQEIFTKDEYASYYPILYHWILAKYFFPISIERPYIINWIINLIKIISFNVFLLSTNYFFNFSISEFIIINLVYLTFPFSYTFWNAKNTGLSARNLGLTFGQIYCYLLFYSIINDHFIIYVLLAIVFCLIIMTSMMALQYVVLTMPIYILMIIKVDVLIVFLCSLIIYALFFKKQASNQLRGLINYYYNYKTHFAEIFIINYRKNIFRDFIWDFWIKVFSTFLSRKEKLQYIYLNPICELFHGFPFLVCLFFVIDFNSLSVAFIFILPSLIIFFLICFNSFRFLGEPQRYLEFIIPFISILFVKNTNLSFQIISVGFVTIYILVISRLTTTKKTVLKKHINLLEFIKNNFNHKDVLISNDQETLKYASQYINFVNHDSSKKIESKNEIKTFYEGTYGCLKPEALNIFHKIHRPNLLFINTSLYDEKKITEFKLSFNLELIFNEDDYFLYQIKN